jgi:broad specificity phosphatase PhoE
VGIQQAAAAGKRLSKWPHISVIYSSPLNRCLQTAEIISQSVRAGVQTLEGVIDIDYGDWQGLTPAEVAADEPELHRQWQEAPQNVTIPGGENLAQVRTRAISALEFAISQHVGQTIAIVSHKVVCKVLVCALLGLDNSHVWWIEQDNSAINVFERLADGYLVKTLNDTCHLEA